MLIQIMVERVLTLIQLHVLLDEISFFKALSKQLVSVTRI